jgi:hypothetical protein
MELFNVGPDFSRNAALALDRILSQKNFIWGVYQGSRDECGWTVYFEGLDDRGDIYYGQLAECPCGDYPKVEKIDYPHLKKSKELLDDPSLRTKSQ